MPRSGPFRRLGAVPSPVRAVRPHTRPGRGGRARVTVAGGRDQGLDHRQLTSTEESAVSNQTLKQLSDAGVSIWLDDLSRERLVRGTLAELVRDKHVVGVTTNPTIFQKAITGSEIYDEQARDIARGEGDVGEAPRAIAPCDVRGGGDGLRPAYDPSDGGDGRVSIEVAPRISGET